MLSENRKKPPRRNVFPHQRIVSKACLAQSVCVKTVYFDLASSIFAKSNFIHCVSDLKSNDKASVGSFGSSRCDSHDALNSSSVAIIGHENRCDQK
ncbi:hypothetical protein L596_000387 [Steinernema carpocapsae]|uniref:Uncharacterized protein n=1 Tax=Steinernema carpocapsae TaxID=34508 RepID=A0A4U8UK91_STECR|nr:hypothetical protein L596_000387 [Steinernema carpocapsae]